MTDCDDLNDEHIDDQNTINCLMGERESTTERQRRRKKGRRHHPLQSAVLWPPFTVCCIMTGRAWNSIITGSYIWPAIWHLTTDIDRFWQIVTDRISASIMLWRGGSGDSVIHASRTWEGPTTVPTKYRSEKETKTSCEKLFCEKNTPKWSGRKDGEYISRDHGFGCHVAPTLTVGPLIRVTQWEWGPSMD